MPTLTSVEIGVRLIGSQEHALSWLHPHQVEEIDGEAADVSGELRVKLEEKVPAGGRGVFS